MRAPHAQHRALHPLEQDGRRALALRAPPLHAHGDEAALEPPALVLGEGHPTASTTIPTITHTHIIQARHHAQGGEQLAAVAEPQGPRVGPRKEGAELRVRPRVAPEDGGPAAGCVFGLVVGFGLSFWGVVYTHMDGWIE